MLFSPGSSPPLCRGGPLLLIQFSSYSEVVHKPLGCHSYPWLPSLDLDSSCQAGGEGMPMDDDTHLWGANVPHFYNMGVSYHRVPANLWSVPLSPGPAHRSQELSLVPRHLRRTERKSCPDWKHKSRPLGTPTPSCGILPFSFSYLSSPLPRDICAYLSTKKQP